MKKFRLVLCKLFCIVAFFSCKSTSKNTDSSDKSSVSDPMNSPNLTVKFNRLKAPARGKTDLYFKGNKIAEEDEGGVYCNVSSNLTSVEYIDGIYISNKPLPYSNNFNIVRNFDSQKRDSDGGHLDGRTIGCYVFPKKEFSESQIGGKSTTITVKALKEAFGSYIAICASAGNCY